MIDPDFWTDEALGTCSVVARLLFMGLISNADDDGRLRGNPALIKATIFPYDEDLTPDDVDDQLDWLRDKLLIRRYHVGGQSYIDIPNFRKHQTINKPTPSKLPPYKEESGRPTTPLQEDSGSPPEQLPPNRREEKLSEEKGESEGGMRTAPNGTEPAPAEIPEFTRTEQAVADCVRAIRGMAGVPPVDIILHIRECLDIRGSPVPDLVMRSEFQKFRDYHQDKRKNQPQNRKWTAWKRAITNWMTKIDDEPEDEAMSRMDRLYPEWQVADE